MCMWWHGGVLIITKHQYILFFDIVDMYVI